MTFKLPEPVIAREEGSVSTGMYYTADQLCAAYNAGLEDALGVLSTWAGEDVRFEEIRKLKEKT